MPSRKKSIAKAAAQILTHMLRHPQIVDTLEGLSRFRLLEDRVQQSVFETSEALRLLVNEGLVLEEGLSDGPRSYSLNPDRIDDAIKLREELEWEKS